MPNEGKLRQSLRGTRPPGEGVELPQGSSHINSERLVGAQRIMEAREAGPTSDAFETGVSSRSAIPSVPGPRWGCRSRGLLLLSPRGSPQTLEVKLKINHA